MLAALNKIAKTIGGMFVFTLLVALVLGATGVLKDDPKQATSPQSGAAPDTPAPQAAETGTSLPTTVILNLIFGGGRSIVWKSEDAGLEAERMMMSKHFNKLLVAALEACEPEDGTAAQLTSLSTNGGVVTVEYGPQKGCTGWVPTYGLRIPNSHIEP